MRTWVNVILFIIVIALIIPTLIVKGCSVKSIHLQGPDNHDGTEEQDEIKLKWKSNEPKIALYDHQKKEVVDMALEEYIAGVVAAEMPVSFEMEALKAQAVAARTFAVKKMHVFGGSGCQNHSEADVCSFYGHCQAWIGEDDQKRNWGNDYEKNRSRIVQAVEETRGDIITYAGEPIEVFFYSTSNGKTEDVSEVFSTALPYYKVVDSPGEEDAPKYKEIFSFSNKQFVDIFKKQYPKSNLRPNNLERQIKILSHTDGDRVKEVQVGNIKIKGKDFRNVYGINSSDFTFEFLKDSVKIHTRGYGHGVGMSQVGADRMAKGGSSYIDIIKHYYVGVDIQKAY
ncbi:stage II sporulation protein D [Xylanivirga thermophila]|uniref:stage II sporulation protein D n=1 Tax=Xylanivirga thermophila TaxID=2496273 RepID=UPI00101CCC0D|nr:stage II sporulation protein D [Xylanivirga thermophila]